jgi:hypothetical protein
VDGVGVEWWEWRVEEDREAIVMHHVNKTIIVP